MAQAAGQPERLPAYELNVIIRNLIKLSQDSRDVRKSPDWAALHPKDKKKVVKALSTGTLLPEPAPAPATVSLSSTASSSQARHTPSPLGQAASASSSSCMMPASTPTNLMSNLMKTADGQFLSLYQPPQSTDENLASPASNSASSRPKRLRAGATSTPVSRKKPRRKRSAIPIATRYYLEDEVVTDSDSSAGEDPESQGTSPKATAAGATTSPTADDSCLLSAAEAKQQQLAVRRAKRAAALREQGKAAVKRFIPRVLPEGAAFCSELRAMMYGFGDSCHPSLQVAAALEADAMRYASEIVRMLRVLSDVKPVSLKLISQHMGGAVAVYFRWKAMKKMAKGDKGGGEEGGDESPVDDQELEEWGEGVQGGGVVASSPLDEDASLVWDDMPAAAVSDGLARGMLVVGEEDEEEADLAAELEANAELEMRQEASGGPAIDVQIDSASAMAAQGALSPWQAFKTRLRFANVRTRNMTSLQYREFARCREAYFTATPSLTKAFSSRLPKPPLKRTCLDVVAYCAFDRVACVVEAANRIVHNGVLSAPGAQLPEPAYTAALAALPMRPPSLELAVRTLHASAAAQAKLAAAVTAIASGLSPDAGDRAASRRKRLAALNAAAALQSEAPASNAVVSNTAQPTVRGAVVSGQPTVRGAVVSGQPAVRGTEATTAS